MRTFKEYINLSESINPKVANEVEKAFKKMYKKHNMILKVKTHARDDHKERESTFNVPKLIRTFRNLLKKYKNKLSDIPRYSPKNDDYIDDNRIALYDKESDYTLLSNINKDANPEIFSILTAYPGRPHKIGDAKLLEI